MVIKTIRIILLFSLIFIYGNATPSNIQNHSPQLHFTQEEQDYLQQKKEILVCDFSEWMPYVGHNDSETFGIVYDYFQTFGSRIGKPIRFIRAAGTIDCAKNVAEGKVDAVASIDNVPNTYNNIISTDSYGKDFLALITEIKTPFITSMNSIENETLAVLKHYKNLHAYLLNAYPNLNLIYVDTIKEGFEKVAKGEIYGIINIYRVAAYNIRREYVGTLKINTKVGKLVATAHIGINTNNKILRNIFNKAIGSITREEKQLMIDRWMRAEQVVKYDYRLLGIIIILFFIIFFSLLSNQYRERRKQKELLSKQSKLAGMGTMINNIAHQWRQPLNRINSNIAVINAVLDSKNINNEILEKKISNIKNNTQYMSETIESFIHFFHPKKTSNSFLIEQMTQQTLDLLGSRLQGIEVNIKCKKDLTIETFENELQQVFLIILHNAVDHLESNTIEKPLIKILIKELNGNVLIMLEDNAKGIKEESIEKIFEPYYTTKFKSEGTGLGLYMAKILVESSMHGYLSAKNIKGGASFTITLPKGKKNA